MPIMDYPEWADDMIKYLKSKKGQKILAAYFRGPENKSKDPRKNKRKYDKKNLLS